MITIDAPISFLLGAGMAYACSKKEGVDYASVFLKGFFVQCCVLTPVILFFLLRFPDWEWNYMFDAKNFFFAPDNIGRGAFIICVLIALLNLSYILGFRLAQTFVEAGKDQYVLYLLGGTGTLILVIMGLMFQQTLHIGTLEQYQNGTAGLVFLNPTFLAAQTSAVILLAIGINYALRREKN